MLNNKNSKIKIPFRDIDARNVLNTWGKQIKEEPMLPKKDGSMQKSPSGLALTIMAISKAHLDYIISGSKEAGFNIGIEQKTQLYFEFITLYYFLIGSISGKYLEGDQFSLFFLQLHVKLLEDLPKYKDNSWLFGNLFTRSKKIDELVGKKFSITHGLSSYLYRGEDFYIRDKLISDGKHVWNILKEINGKSVFEPTNDETQGYERLKRLLLPEEAKTNNFAEYKKNLMLQFMIKNFHLVMKILRPSVPSWDKDLEMTFFLYGRNSDYILSITQSKFIKNFQPTWDSI